MHPVFLWIWYHRGSGDEVPMQDPDLLQKSPGLKSPWSVATVTLNPNSQLECLILTSSQTPVRFKQSMSDVTQINAADDIGSVSHWLRELKAGDEQAVEAIWNRYYQRVVELAIRKMKVNNDRAVDGEDVAQLVMHRFCMNATRGCYPNLDDREQLWDLLVVFTLNRIRKHLRACNTLKRSGLHRQVFEFRQTEALEDLQRPEAPTIMADMVETWLKRLDREDPSGELKQIAIWSMDDISGSEIARILRKRKSSVLQQIRLIRLLWEDCES